MSDDGRTAGFAALLATILELAERCGTEATRAANDAESRAWTHAALAARDVAHWIAVARRARDAF